MKKNIIRVLALALVASMLFAFASCSQEIRVRFVKEDGSDIDFESIFGGSGGGSATPANTDSTPVDNTPVTDAAPVTDASPATDATPATDAAPATTAAPSGSDTPATTAAPATSAQPTSSMPTTPQAILDFYKAAVKKVKNGEAGYNKKSWQAIGDLKITGIGMVDDAIKGEVAKRMTTEDAAETQVNAKGSGDATGRMPDCTLTDVSKIASATCNADGGNYKIKIVMQNEDTPRNKNASVLGQITDNILYADDIDAELKNVSIISGTPNYQVIYEGFTIECVISPDGKFVSMLHYAKSHIVINEAKILIATLKNKDAYMDAWTKYDTFSY